MINLSDIPKSVLPSSYATESGSGKSIQIHLHARNSLRKKWQKKSIFSKEMVVEEIVLQYLIQD